MKRQLLLSLAATLLALPSLARNFEYTYEGKTITYTVISESAKTCETAINNVSGALILPSNPKEGNIEYTLVKIGKGAFDDCSGLTYVSIPNSVTYIGEWAFAWCSDLKSIAIPNSVTKIGESAFSMCSGLTSVSIPNSVTEIGDDAFHECSQLKSIVIPNSITTIGEMAFSMCSSLTSVNIPNSVTSIGSYAFSGCISLEEILISLKDDCNIGSSIFSGCDKLDKVYIVSNFKLLSRIPNNYITIYTLKDFFEKVKEYKPMAELVVMPGLDIKSTSFKCDEISLIENKTEGGALKNVIFEGQVITPKSGTYTITGVEPCTAYTIDFQYTLDKFEGLELTSSMKFSSYVIESISIENTTQSTVAFKLKTPDDSRITDRKLIFYYDFFTHKEFSVDKNNIVTIKNLNSNSAYHVYGSATFKGKTYSFSDYAKTNKVEPQIIAELTPTMIIMRPTINKGDATIESENLKINGTEYNIKAQQFINQPLGKGFRTQYSVNNETFTHTFVLPQLVLNTMAARAASKDCAIICAETNMSEEEYGGGFEWRRYDAPDLVPSTFSPCPVANGHMEGRLKGLSQSTYYKYRPYYEDCNGDRTFGEWTAFITADADVYFEPTVYTYSPNSITKNSAKIVGYAIGGSEDIVEQGFEYWPISGSRSTADVKRIFATGQRMIVTIDDLEPGTRYAVRAFVTTKTKTSYGDKQEFETEADPNGSILSPRTDIEENTPFDVYTLTGVCVRRQTTDLSGLQRGIYIIRTGASSRKTFIN